MFGHHKLYREGAVARGVIIRLFAEREHNTVAHYDVLVDVQFEDGTHGQIKERVKHADVGHCREGDVLPVRYDPRDPSKLVLDMPAIEAMRYELKENVHGEAAPDGFQAGGSATVFTGADGLRTLLGGGSMAEIIREARHDPQGLRDRLIEQAQAAGAQVFVSQSGGMTPVGQPGMAPEPDMETAPEFQAQSQLDQELFEQSRFEQAQAPVQFQAPVQPQTPVQFQAPVQPHKQPEPGDFDPNEEF